MTQPPPTRLEPAVPRARSHRYAAFLDRRRWSVLLVSALVTAAGLILAARLPILADVTHLLPPNERSVQDLKAIEARARATGTVLIAVRADTVARRAQAAALLTAELSRVEPRLVSNVVVDSGDARRYAWANRFLFVSLADLRAARDALARKIEDAKLAANPAYVSFEDEEPKDDAADEKLEDLRNRLSDAEREANAPSQILSKDGTSQLLFLRTPFPSGEISNGKELTTRLERIFTSVRRQMGPGVDVGAAGDVVVAAAEQRSILNGMILATVLTVVVVSLGLLLYYRSGSAVIALLVSLLAGTLATFGVTRLGIGHLNSVTAFLASIVVGNGINFGIIFLARYLEERRHGRRGVEALGASIGGTMAGTLAAALAAGVAYASLVATDFRGFRHFGLIGGIGMVLCWGAAYTVLPAMLAVLDRAGRVRPRREPAIGQVLVRVMPQRLSAVAAVGALVTLACGVASWRYLASDPFEYNWSKLRSTGPDAREQRRWMDFIDREFGKGLFSSFALAVPRRDDVPAVVAALKAADAHADARHHLIGKISSLDDLIPSDQPEKLKLLAELRTMIDKESDALSDEERKDVRRLRPPDDLRPITAAEVPESLAQPFTEKDGTRGRLVFVNYGSGVQQWNGRSLEVFSRRVRELDLPPGTALGGNAFVFSDILEALERDGPRATAVALIGVILFVLVVVGWRRHAGITLLCAAAGTTAMVACGWLLGLKVNFLDFVALPITLGISVDYSVNIVMREREEGPGSARRALATTGGAVVLCSFTTSVGYGSLLLSENSGIRSFGVAAMLGEITCLLAALALGPALLHVLRPHPQPRPAEEH